MIKMIKIFFLASLITIYQSCHKDDNSNQSNNSTNNTTNEVDFWLTKPDQSVLLQKQLTKLSFNTNPNSYNTIDVDETITYQSIDGFGYSLTGGSAYLINKMNSADANNLLTELFSRNETCIGINYLRISLGASDLSKNVFSYNDLPNGQTDINLTNFSLSDDTLDLIPVLKKIIAINPSIKIMASPWSAPVWMKSNNSSVGGSLLPQYYEAYAKYFIKYIQQMKSKGISIDAITIQNEPEHGGNNPSMLMTATEQANFIKNYLGPLFTANSITTKIIVYDHNCDHPNYPISVLNDPVANTYIDGSAFHLYAGDISALNTVKSAHPTKNLYFTEQWTGANGLFAEDLKWHIKNVVIGSMRNYAKVALEWNLAADAQYQPHTNGGCTECKGALTISGSSVNRNVSYYIIAHASKFVPANSIRVASTGNSNGLSNVAFITPSQKKVLIVLNENTTNQLFNIKYNNKWITVSLPAGSVGTYVW